MNLSESLAGNSAQSPQDLRTERFFKPLLNGLLAGLVLLLAAGAMLVNFHLTMTRKAEDSMRNSLRRAALACALTIDPEVHASLTEAAQQGSPPYEEACDRLRQAKEAMQGPEKFHFVYTCVLRDEKVYFILDPTPAGDSDGDGVDDKSHLMDPYPEADPEMISTLKTGEVVVMKEPESDRWGTFLSGYAPISDATGKVIALVGVDMELSFYENEIHDIKLATLFAALGLLLVSTLVGYGVWHHEKRMHAAIIRLEDKTEAAQAASTEKSRFLATMSDEIRTPMSGVIGPTELLLNTPLTAEQRDYVQTIQTSGEGLLAVLNDILDFSKIEAGSLTVESKPVRVKELVSEVVKLFVLQAKAKGLHLDSNISRGTPLVIETDLARLRQILINLVSNAVKFTNTGSISLCVSPDRMEDGRPGIRFTITDTGIGISKEQHHRLFLPFSQVDSSTTRKYNGTGLGLVIADRVCRALGGRIKLDSTPGAGSSFHFVLSAPTAADVENASGLCAAPASTGEGPSDGQRSEALIICADGLLRTLLLRRLEKQGWKVFVAEKMEAALASGPSPDLVVFDLDLASGSAAVFVEEVMQRFPALRYAAIDSGVSPENRAAILATGISALLPRNPSAADLALFSPVRISR